MVTRGAAAGPERAVAARRSVLAALIAGCNWSLPVPRPAPDAGATDRPAPNDVSDAPPTPLDMPRVDAPAPRDTPAPRDAPSLLDAPMDRAAPPDRPDVVAPLDTPAPVDAGPPRDAPASPDVSDVPAPQDVVITECVPGARRTCYTGPPSSRGVGACRDGVQTCGTDGRWPSLCDGQSLPLCAGRVCGTDGCGGVCGACTGGTLCDDTGRCQPVTCGMANFTITCPDATRCPRDSHCVTGGRCECDEGFVAESCAGVACGACAFPNWWCRRAFFCGGGSIVCPGNYLCPVRSRCETVTMSCDCEPGFTAVDCAGARCTSCPGVSYRCAAL